MDRQTLSNYGWIVIAVLILAVMLAFATPFGKYIGKGVSNLAMSMVGANDNAVDQNNIDQIGKEWENYLDPLNPKGVIPEGATYTQYVNGYADYNNWTYTYDEIKIYTAGDKFPTVAYDGDIFTFGDYEYCYRIHWCTDCEQWARFNCDGCWLSNNDWAVRCINDIAVPCPILESINNKPITSLRGAFYSHHSLITAPKIPNTVTDMYYTFMCCNSLTKKPTIPSSVRTSEYDIFWGCAQFGY